MLLHKLIILQKKVVKVIDDQPSLSHTSPIFAKLNILKIEHIVFHQILILMHNVFMENAPLAIGYLFNLEESGQKPSRIPRTIIRNLLPLSHTVHTPLAGLAYELRLWNSIIAPKFTHDVSPVPTSKRQHKEIVK